jgi:hypothetical protein
MRWARRSSNWTSFSAPWARAWDGHEVVDLAVGRLALHYAEENPDEVLAAPRRKKRGRERSDTVFSSVTDGACPLKWRPAYRWMAGAMQRRLPSARRSAVAPVWAWLKWSRNSARPDLRTPGHVPSGTRAVRLEFLTTADDILCSDFEAWHFALNYWYLPKDHADGRRFEAQLRRRGLDFYRTKPLRDR